MKLPLMGAALVLALLAPGGGASAADAPESPRIFYVRDFGAVPDGTDDSGPGIRRAVAAAMAASATGRPAEVVFEAGAYRLGAEHPQASVHTWWGRRGLSITGASHLTLRGTGQTEWVLTDPQATGLYLEDCSDVRVQGIALDNDPLPFAQGTVVAVDPASQTFQAEFDPPYRAIARSMIEDPDPISPLSVIPVAVGGEEPVYGPWLWAGKPTSMPEEGRWTVPLSRPDGTSGAGLAVGKNNTLEAAHLHPGDRFVYLSRSTGADLAIIRCTRIVVEDVTLYAGGGLASFVHLSDGVLFHRFAIQLRPGSGRLLSTCADGIHARGNRGGIVIDGCTFEGMGDDAINLHSSAILPVRRIGPAEFLFKNHTYSIRAGDLLEAVRPDQAAILGSYRVAQATPGPEGWDVVFSEPLPEIHTGGSFAAGDAFYNLSEANAGFAVRNCHFSSFRGRDLLVSAIQGTVENNQFDLWHSSGFNIGYEGSVYAEGPIARQIEVKGNRFTGKNGNASAIVVWAPAARGGTSASSSPYADITIEDNRFDSLRGSAAVLQRVSGLVLRNNRVTGDGPAPAPGVPRPAFSVTHCEGARIEGNQVADPFFSGPLK